MKYTLYIFFSCLLFMACKNETKKREHQVVKGTPISLKYAEGFSSTDYGTYNIIEVKQPWPNANVNLRYAVLKPSYNASTHTIEPSEYEAIIKLPIKNIVVTSTTHIPALELLRVEEALIGFPETDFISSENIRQRIDGGFVKEIGKNESLNTEVLLELQPDVLIGFGIDGTNGTFETLKKSGIPVIYNGDWVEHSPLAKAEWIKFFGILFNKEKTADSIFNHIETNYQEAKAIAQNAKRQPTILSGAMHNDIWFLPNGRSTEAQLLKDANVKYLWADSNGTGSLQLNFESVFEKAHNADIWLNPSNYSSLKALENANAHHGMFKAFKTKNVYSFTNTTGSTGGVLYYELGYARPDWVLKDIINICHPKLLNNYEPRFFKPLP